MANNFFRQCARVGAVLHSRRCCCKCAARVVIDEGFNEFIRRNFGVYFAAACGNQLQRRKCVACRATTVCQHMCNRVFAYGQVGVGNHPTNVCFQVVHWQQMKLQVLRAATNGFTYFLWVGSGKHKHHMWWWFFQSLQQRGLGWLREHVYFVENKHAMAAGVAKRRSFDQVAHVFYAVVTGGIQLQHVVAVAAVDCATRVAHAAWLAFLWVFAVQNFCQDAGG